MMNVPSGPINNAANAPTSSGLPQVGEQCVFAGADPAGNGLAYGSGADDDGDLSEVVH
ncbi:Unknown protein sequence [Pseudomonas syringae pv. cilantro]|uniref:Uncharacterized protein n=1 Tax=Pseudomonas syringae pv. cilantro TaxID=81035 RepID=A0A0N0X7Y9_PSESX|nr:Unknown protein sequence [Pseudomonas syringae pv. cilantro]